MAPARKSLEERFWAKAEKRGPQECWPWTAATVQGYGVINAGGHKSRMLRAPRVSWEIHHGPIPRGLCVCHRCDNPSCVNPAHLFLGTRLANARDRSAKGRDPDSKTTRRVGETNGRAILTEDDVREIRRKTEPIKVQAARFGVCQGTIEAIRGRRLWRHVAREVVR